MSAKETVIPMPPKVPPLIDLLSNRILGVADVARLLGMSPNWVRDHAATLHGKPRKMPKLVGIKMGERRTSGNWKFLESDVADFVRKMREGA